MKTFKYFLVTLLSFIIISSNAQNTIFGCTDTSAANYDSTATQELAGPVEFPVQCNQNGWGGNYVGINLALYQANPSEFAVGTKVTIAGHDYWIDAMNIPGNCNQGVALIYIALAPGLADGNPWSPAGNVVQPVVPGDEWNITECFYNNDFKRWFKHLPEQHLQPEQHPPLEQHTPHLQLLLLLLLLQSRR